jgi:uncharacterized surface protein with fasciclin (FAS1) repeats
MCPDDRDASLLPLSNPTTHTLSQETLNAIIADKEKLTSILTYHVVPGKVAAADVVKVRACASRVCRGWS